MNTVYLYSDGGCHGNPGPGGWAWRLVDGDGTVLAERSGFEGTTTNNRMELQAVIDGLNAARIRFPEPIPTIVVVTDSQYVRQGITDWIRRWRKNGWITTAKRPVKNGELWRALDEVNTATGAEWQWVKGHAGDTHNEACDRLVQEAIRTGEM